MSGPPSSPGYGPVGRLEPPDEEYDSYQREATPESDLDVYLVVTELTPRAGAGPVRRAACRPGHRARRHPHLSRSPARNASTPPGPPARDFNPGRARSRLPYRESISGESLSLRRIPAIISAGGAENVYP